MLAQPGAEITSASWFGTGDAAAMAVTDGKCLARLKGCAGISARAEDAPGGPRKPQEAPGNLRRPQEVARSPMGLQEAQGGSRRPEEAPGGSRRLQEAQGGFRKPQGIPGGPRRIHEALGKLQDVPGDPGKLQGAPGARRIGERMCAAPQRERNFQKTCARRRSESDILPCRARCAPRPIPATNFAKPTTRKSTLSRNT